MTENFQRNKAVIKIFVNIYFENYVAFHCNSGYILFLTSFLDSVSTSPTYCLWCVLHKDTPT